MNRIKIKAWGPFQIYMSGYTAPDTKTAALVYLSLCHGLVANLILNHVCIFFLYGGIPFIFKVTFLVSILYGMAFSYVRVGNSSDHSLRQYSIMRSISEIVFLIIGVACVFLIVFSSLYVGMSSGFQAVYIIYCLLHPLVFYPIASVAVSNIVANLMRLFLRSV